MYQPPAFREQRREVLLELIRSHPAGLLVSHGADGLGANLVPFVIAASEPSEPLILECHLSRANSQWRDLQANGACLVVFQGPQAYVTPSWYPAKAEHGRTVPTWNYVVVQAKGAAAVVEDHGWLRSHVERLTDHNEAPLPEPWLVSDAPEDFVASQLKGIVGLRIAVASLEGKWKLNQNRSLADRHGAAAGLTARGGSSAEVGALMTAGLEEAS